MLDRTAWHQQFQIPIYQKAKGAIYLPEKVIEITPELFDEIRPEAVLGYIYESYGAPTSWYSSLRIIPLESDSVGIIVVREEMPIELFALLSPSDNKEIWSVFIQDLLANNGEAYSVEIFTLLPTLTKNYRPDLFSESDLRSAYWEFMKWAEVNKPLPWKNLSNTLKNLEDPPGLDIFDNFDLEKLRREQLRDKEWEEGLSVEEKQDFLEQYFQRCYSELTI